MSLASIEKAFVDNLLKPQTNEAGFLSELLPLDSLKGSLDQEKQLFIYRSNINGAHQKVLGQIYPACLNILGEDYFNQLCRAYRFEYPSKDPDLNNYGAFFSAFIAEQLNLHEELNGFEYLVDLACLEWHWHSSYYAKDNALFDFEKLTLVDPALHNKLVFSLSDSFSLHSTLYPLLDVWQANKSDVDDKQEFLMPESKCYFCISRVNFSPVIEVLNRFEYKLLKSIADGLPLSQLSNIGEYDANDGFQNQLIKFIQKNWLTGFLVQG